MTCQISNVQSSFTVGFKRDDVTSPGISKALPRTKKGCLKATKNLRKSPHRMASRTKASEQLSDFAAAKKVCGNVRYYLLISCLRICPGGIDAPMKRTSYACFSVQQAFFPGLSFKFRRKNSPRLLHSACASFAFASLLRIVCMNAANARNLFSWLIPPIKRKERHSSTRAFTSL